MRALCPAKRAPHGALLSLKKQKRQLRSQLYITPCDTPVEILQHTATYAVFPVTLTLLAATRGSKFRALAFLSL